MPPQKISLLHAAVLFKIGTFSPYFCFIAEKLKHQSQINHTNRAREMKWSTDVCLCYFRSISIFGIIPQLSAAIIPQSTVKCVKYSENYWFVISLKYRICSILSTFRDYYDAMASSYQHLITKYWIRKCILKRFILSRLCS